MGSFAVFLGIAISKLNLSNSAITLVIDCLFLFLYLQNLAALLYATTVLYVYRSAEINCEKTKQNLTLMMGIFGPYVL